MSVTRRIFVWLTALMLSLAGCADDPGHLNAIAEVVASMQKDKLVAEARLSPEYVANAMGMLSSGESLLVTYHFELHLQNRFLPDTGLSQGVVVRRRLRRSLILERYEMQDLSTKHTTFTADDGEAAQFLGNPRFVVVAQKQDIIPNRIYVISAKFKLDEDGFSGILRELREWIFFWETNSYFLQGEYRLS